MRVAHDASQAIRTSDVITCATSSLVPVLDAADLPEHVHINAIGSYRLDMRELPDAAFSGADVVVDSIEAAEHEAGEVVSAIASAQLRSDVLTELGRRLNDDVGAASAADDLQVRRPGDSGLGSPGSARRGADGRILGVTPPLGIDRIRRFVQDVPRVLRYPGTELVRHTFAELQTAHPDVVRCTQIGTSRLGTPIMETTIGSGARSAMVVAGVHPNEVVGFVTAIELARLLVANFEVRDGLGYTWHFVENLDPDGVRLNEPWFDVPGDRTRYARRFFRPAPADQPEWTFPTSYRRAYFDRMLPETVALARRIDDVRPELYVSLHNSETGGAYWYVGDADAEAADDLRSIAHQLDVPIDVGEAESPHLIRFSPGVFRSSTFAEDYDAAERAGDDPAESFCGSSATEYAAARGARTLIPEVPYWIPVTSTVDNTDESHAEMIGRTAADMGAVADRLHGLLSRADPHLRIPSPFAAAARAFVPMMVADARADVSRAAYESSQHRMATTAETLSRETRVRGFALRYGGMLRRALEAEVFAGTATAEARACLAEADEFFEQWLERGEPVETVALDPTALVGTQLGSSILILADRARP